MNYRLVYAGLGLALVAVVALGLGFGSAGGAPVDLPDPIESVNPRPGDTIQRQAPIEVDMVTGYDLEIFIDGIPIPDDQVVGVEATGLFWWRPGPAHLFEQWTRGEHTARIVWNTSSGLSDTGEYQWSFRSF